MYWLATARREGEKPAKVLDRAVALAGYKDAAAKLTKDALLRNLDIADKLGCLNSEVASGNLSTGGNDAPEQDSICLEWNRQQPDSAP